MTAWSRAFAKLNLVLHVGRARDDGLHAICSLFASLRLADEVRVEEAAADEVVCPGVEGHNLAAAALASFRAAVPGAALPPLRVTIEKRIPVAAGLGGGSADAAAVLRAANDLAEAPLDRELAAGGGGDARQRRPEPGGARARPRVGRGRGRRAGGAAVHGPRARASGAGPVHRRVYAELDRLRAGGAVAKPRRSSTSGG